MIARQDRTLLAIQLAILFVVLSIFSLGLRTLKTTTNLRVPPTQVINPTPIKGQDGVEGMQGLNGISGEKGAKGDAGVKGDTGATGATGAVGEPGIQGDQGIQGEPAAPARETELRTNPLNNNLEWKYVDDTSWHLLIKQCQITDSCL